MIFKNIISINDFSSKNELLKIMRDISLIKQLVPVNLVPLKTTFLFLESSTRTLGSYAEAARKLGFPIKEILGAESTSLIKRESFADTARMLAGHGTDILVMRSKIEGAQRFISELLEKEGYSVSVQNAGDGTNQHPTQTLLDLFTILEHKDKIDSLKIGFFGDLKYGRTVHSLIKALSLFDNIEIYLASDKETALQEEYKNLFPKENVFEGDTLELLKKCDVIYGTRIQDERFLGDNSSLQRALAKFQIDRENIKTFKEDAIFMHPLPMPKDFPQFTKEARKDKRVIFIKQAENGIPTRIFCLSEGGINRREKSTIKPAEAIIEIRTSVSIKEYFETRGSKNNYQYFKPITEGLVIDHIEKGFASKIETFLWKLNILDKDTVIHTIKNVPTKKNHRVRKDVLILENVCLDDHTLKRIASISPTVVFNEVNNGHFTKKIITNLSYTEGMGKCPNEKCITNHDDEATVRFDHGGNLYKCHFCEKHFSRNEIF